MNLRQFVDLVVGVKAGANLGWVLHSTRSAGLLPPFRRFLSDRRGAVAILAGIMFPVTIGGIGLGVETSYWYMTQRKLQHAADVAAHAGAVRHRSGDSLAGVRAAATTIATASGFLPNLGTVVVNLPPSSGAFAGNPDAVEVILREDWPRWFTRLFAEGAVPINARAVARIFGGSGTGCVLALSQTASPGVSVTGSTSASLSGCSVASNSVQPTAFSQTGSGTLSTDCVVAVGGVSAGSGLTVSQPDCPRPNSGSVRDPYRNVTQPALAGSCDNNSGNVGKPNQATTLTPSFSHPSGVPSMRFCKGLDAKGQVTFNPGLYIIEGGDFTINGGGAVTDPARLIGSGVTFFLSGGARLRLNGNVTLTLSAPTDPGHPYRGILFFGDRAATGLSHVINGNPGSTLTGAVYMPAGNLSFSGSSTGTSGCTQVIASTVVLTGNSTLSSDCASAGTRTIVTNEQVSLVE